LTTPSLIFCLFFFLRPSLLTQPSSNSDMTLHILNTQFIIYLSWFLNSAFFFFLPPPSNDPKWFPEALPLLTQGLRSLPYFPAPAFRSTVTEFDSIASSCLNSYDPIVQITLPPVYLALPAPSTQSSRAFEITPHAPHNTCYPESLNSHISLGHPPS